MKLAASMSPTQHIQRPPLEGMALTNDGYLVGISGEVVVVGSLSSGSLTRFRTHPFSRKWEGGLRMVVYWSSFSNFSSKTSWKT
jgi:hypothetical protein